MVNAGTVEHPIVVEPIAGRVRVLWRGHVVADTRRALALSEADYPMVVYVPRADAEMSAFERGSRVTICRYKGEANYFSLVGDGVRDDHAVWSYETPIRGLEVIREHLAFYPDNVAIEREG